jgi:hypothetical protein
MTLGLRQSRIPRQPNPFTLQREAVRLPLTVLRSSLLHCAQLPLSCSWSRDAQIAHGTLCVSPWRQSVRAFDGLASLHSHGSLLDPCSTPNYPSRMMSATS